MRKLFIPEVVQTSSLDCGPAALKALCEGFGRQLSYGRLREACQTGLDGASIDTLEQVANQLGLEAEQIMLPLDHLLLPQARALPAIVVVTLAQGITHFVVVWRRFGNWLQIMDPAVGRRWLPAASFIKDVYQHAITVGAEAWFEFAGSEDFQRVFKARRKLAGLNANQQSAKDWKQAAAADAALRLTIDLLEQKGIRRGKAAQNFFDRLNAQPHLIPPAYWSVREAGVDEENNPQLLMRGAVLVRIKWDRGQPEADLSQELSAALQEKPANPAREISSAVLRCGFRIWPLLLFCILAASGAAFFESLLFRGLLDVNATLALTVQRMGAAAAVLIFCFTLLSLELPSFLVTVRVGRTLENRLRIAFLEKLPKLADRYFQSRPVSDMAERSHILHRLRHLPDKFRQLLLSCCQLFVTACGVVWLDPSAWPFMLGSLAAALIPLFSSAFILAERDLRVRTHSGGLMRFYLDAMLGLMPIRTHGAATNLRREHALLLNEWTSASFRLQRAVVLTESLQLTTMFVLAAALLVLHPFSGEHVGRVLLMAYWALNMPALGQDIATLARQYPSYRSIILRLLEPLGAPEDTPQLDVAPLSAAPAIHFENVSVVASGNTILSSVTHKIPSGANAAIVGPSGAGKSSLVALLLGWLKPSEGEILINGGPLSVEQIRLSAAWVDPAIQLWNQSLQANLTYGGDPGFADLGCVIDAAALRNVLENLPLGLQTPLGENGGLVSGGEGQRVRFGRALGRKEAKLVILDEPFRGLDREKRRELLRRAREHWAAATLLCITHDISETLDFDQVLVVEGGTLTESGSPGQLARNPQSRYAQLLAAEEKVRSALWDAGPWRRIRLHSGRVIEEMPLPVGAEERESELA